MANDTHDLQLTVLLLSVSERAKLSVCRAYLETLILKDTLDSCILAVGSKLGLEDYTKRAISHDLTLRVLHLLRLASQAVLHFFTNDL